MSFKMRTTKPEAGNKYYITKSNGGYSDAIKGNSANRDKDCNVLPNCVGYAYGRFNEIGGYGYCKYLKPVNAENFIQHKDPELKVGQTPKVGACMVWQKGNTLTGSDGAGHVAIVEKVVSDTEVYTSESGWNSQKVFYNKTRKKDNGNWGQSSSYKFLGFIYNPAVKDENKSVVNDSTNKNTANGLKYKVGDKVKFTGSEHFKSSDATTAKKCKAGAAKVTAIAKGEKHPYHLIAESNGGSTVYGWVNEKDVSSLTSDNSGSTPSVKIDSAKSYSESFKGTYKATTRLNMRAGAGTSKSILTVIPKDGVVNCYGYYTATTNNKWYYVTYKDSNGTDYTGFVSSKYLKK